MSDALRDAQGSPVSGIAFSHIFYEVSSAVRQFQVVQHPDRSVTVRVVPCAQLPPDAIAQIHRGAARLLAGIDVRVELVPDLPRSPAGKHRLVVAEQLRPAG